MPIKLNQAIAKQQGMSLIELMVALVISLIVLGGLLSLYLAINQSSFDLIRNIKLEQEMRATIHFMAKDIRRAGFLNDAHLDIGDANYCSLSYFDDCTNKNTRISTTASSIAFSYDADLNGTPEDYSFSLSNNEVTYLYPGSGGNAVSLTSAGSTTFTSLTFTLSPEAIQILNSDGTTASELTIREVTITATAYATGDDPMFARTVTETVRVRNDEYNTF